MSHTITASPRLLDRKEHQRPVLKAQGLPRADATLVPGHTGRSVALQASAQERSSLWAWPCVCAEVTDSSAACTEPPTGPAAPQRDVPPTASGV